MGKGKGFGQVIGRAATAAVLVAAWLGSLARGEDEAQSEPLPQVLLKTSQGDVVVELYEDEAPNTVANFVYLVEKDFYDGLTFHRVIEDFMAQGGCPLGNGRGGPGYRIKCECRREDHRKHKRGVLSMAHAGRDTGGSQFFITLVKTPWLDGKHTVFGRVVEGMENVEKLKRTGPGVEPDRIVEAVVKRKRGHEYVPRVIRDEGEPEGDDKGDQ